MNRLAGWLLPALVGVVALGAWEAAIRLLQVPPYIVPAPSRIALALVQDWAILGPALLYTLKIAALAPIPSARVSTLIVVKPGLPRSRRAA